jgi:Domain of unknown function (DUF4262)
MGITKLYDDIAEDIRRDGRSVLCVSAEPNKHAFCYTIGNWERRLPELLMIRAASAAAGQSLNALSNMMIDRGRAFASGERIAVASITVKIIRADSRAREQYTIQAGQHFGHEHYEVLQVLLSDLRGHFPDEPGYRARLPIPVLRANA